MTKTDDGFCCSFNTKSIQESFAWNEKEMEVFHAFDDFHGTEFDFDDMHGMAAGSGHGVGDLSESDDDSPDHYDDTDWYAASESESDNDDEVEDEEDSGSSSSDYGEGYTPFKEEW